MWALQDRRTTLKVNETFLYSVFVILTSPWIPKGRIQTHWSLLAIDTRALLSLCSNLVFSVTSFLLSSSVSTCMWEKLWVLWTACIYKWVTWTTINWLTTRVCLRGHLVKHLHVPYRNLNYKAYKFAMVLSSLDIHELNVSRMTLVFFC